MINTLLIEEAEDLLYYNVKKSLLVQDIINGDYLRASQIYDICPREEVLVRFLGVPRQTLFSAKSAARVKAGAAFHEAFRSSFVRMNFGNGRIGYLVGKWFCVKCGKIFGDDDNWVRKPEACDCGNSQFVYMEITFKDDNLLLLAHVDGILELSLSNNGTEEVVDKILVEFKLVGSNSFKGYVKKIGFSERYYYQVQTYMFLSGFRRTLFCVVNVDAASEGELVKLFYIHYDEKVVEIIKKKASDFAEGMRNNVLPPGVCVTPLDPRARLCPVAKECFFNQIFGELNKK